MVKREKEVHKVKEDRLEFKVLVEQKAWKDPKYDRSVKLHKFVDFKISNFKRDSKEHEEKLE